MKTEEKNETNKINETKKEFDKYDMTALEKEYTEFITQHNNCNFQQSVEWGRIKEAWDKEIVVSRDEEGKIQGGILLLIRTVKPIGTIIYASRGPVCNNEMYILEELTDKMKEVAKRRKAMAILLEPDALASDLEFENNMKELGFKIKETKNFEDQINPRFVFRLDIKNKTEDELMKAFHSKTRYNIRYAKKKGVEVFEGTRDDLKKFHEIMIETGKRDNFGIRPLSYFEKMYDELGEKHFKLLMSKHDGEVLSGIILIMYGNKVWYLYGASSNHKRNLMPNYLLQWEGIKFAKSLDADIYDFRGVPGVLDGEKDHPEYGLYRFKKGFDAEFTEFIGQVYMPIKPLTYKFFMFAQKAVRKLNFIKGVIKSSFKKLKRK